MSYNDKANIRSAPAIQWKEIVQDDQDDEVRYSDLSEDDKVRYSDLSEKDILFFIHDRILALKKEHIIYATEVSKLLKFQKSSMKSGLSNPSLLRKQIKKVDEMTSHFFTNSKNTESK